jgi:hypothetical protein
MAGIGSLQKQEKGSNQKRERSPAALVELHSSPQQLEGHHCRHAHPSLILSSKCTANLQLLKLALS